MRWAPLKRDSKIYWHVVYGEDSQLQQLSGNEKSWIKQKERLNRNTVVTEPSVDSLGSSSCWDDFSEMSCLSKGPKAFVPHIDQDPGCPQEEGMILSETAPFDQRWFLGKASWPLGGMTAQSCRRDLGSISEHPHKSVSCASWIHLLLWTHPILEQQLEDSCWSLFLGKLTRWKLVG